MRLRIVQLNAAFDPAIDRPDELLDRYETLTAWSEEVAQAGAEVVVVQRFSTDARLERRGVPYRFIADGGGEMLAPAASSGPAVVAAAEAAPDIVHVNGLVFPRLVADLRQALPARAAIVVQDHAGAAPRPRPWWVGGRASPGLACADAVSFTSRDQAIPWRRGLLLGDARILEIVEASTRLTATPAESARRHTGLSGAPLLLWVGRLNANKDPLTVLDACERSFPGCPDARLALIWNGDAPLERDVRDRIDRSPMLRERVTLVGSVPHDLMPHYFGSADAFISGSHAEGSGYALIEAMACGLAPVVTDIPSFRAIAGPCGILWPAGDAHACAGAIDRACRVDRGGARSCVRDRFERQLSWNVLAARTLDAYRELVRDRRLRVGDA